MKTVYLAGPITGCSYEEARFGWRQDFQDKVSHDIAVLSPMRQEGHLKEVQSISGMGIDEHFWSKAKAVFAKDKFDVKRCDVVVVNLRDTKRVSIGTMVELGWAEMLGKPIIIIIEPPEIAAEVNLHHHLFVYEAANFVVHSIDDAVHIVNGLLSSGV